MCGECQSTEWDSIESKLEGEIISFTQMHYPKFPGYPYPLLCAVIKLSEGTNLVANLAGCAPEQIKIGMKVTAISDDAEDPNSIAHMAKKCKTIPYEIAVHIPGQLKRVVR